MQGKKKV